MASSKALRNLDWPFLLTILAMVAVGVAFIWSCTHWVDARAGLAAQQLRWFAVSLLVMITVLAVDYRILQRLSYLGYLMSLGALALVLMIGVTINNAQRWIALPGFMAQPSEVAKIFVILALARYLMDRPDLRTWRGLSVPLLIAAVPMALIIVEPDLGTTLLFIPPLCAMLLVAGAPWKKLLTLAGAGILTAPLLWVFLMGNAQKGRIISFMYPEADPSGTGWHVRQSVLAIAAGGITGNGFSSGSPVLLNRGFAAHTDFIFAVIAHEVGFIGALLVLLLILLFFARATAIANSTRELYGKLLVTGFLALLAFQALVNVCMTVRLCPVTGITLPFISYGGSSLLVCFIMVGLMLNVGMRRKT